jgi:hypothetical protein
VKLILSAVVAAFLFITSWYAASYLSKSKTVQLKAPKNLVLHGNHAQAMEQARELLKELAANDWNRKRVNPALLRLPDQDFAEMEMDRHPDSDSFSGSHPNSPFKFYEKEVAFFSQTYVRRNVKPGPGIEGVVSKVEGFFIVGWKDGRVTKVPVEEVRMVAQEVPMGNNKAETAFCYVFPGMTVYDKSLPKMAGLNGDKMPKAVYPTGSGS